MTLRKEHGNRVYQFAWVVEWSLFAMAIIVAGLNIYTAWQQGASVAAIPALALAFGWVVIACIELCTIPLAGSLALTRWREKPLNLLAVFGLCALSMFTVYEFNESASFNLTRGARLAVIENENDMAEINRNENRVDDFGTQSDAGHARMAKVQEQYRDELKSHVDQKTASLGAIDAKIARQDIAMRGDPLLTERLDELKAEVDRKRKSHAGIVDRQVATFESAIEALERDKERVGPDAQAGVTTGAFTGGAEKVSRMQKQYDLMLDRQKELQQQIQETVISKPDVSVELAMIQEIELQRVSEAGESKPQNKTAMAVLRVERQTAFDAWQAKRESIESAYQLKVREYQDSVETEGKRAEGRKEKSDTLRAGIITRTKTTDAQFEPILYYRMAKWFHSGDGLPTKEDYAQVQWFIFAPIGAFFGIVSIALAYLGMAMRRHGSDELAPARVTRNSVRRENRLQSLGERNLMLEEQACNQAMDLVAMRQEAFAAIKQIPQVVKLHEPDAARPSKALTWLPWCACMLMSLVALGAVVYSVNRATAKVPMAFGPASVVMSNAGNSSSSRINNNLLDSVVMIQTEDGIGSGFFVQADGLLLTSAHVIDGDANISVLTRQGPSYLGTTMDIDESRDLALVKIAASNMPTLQLSVAKNEHVGNDVIVVGSPHGLEWSVSKGILSSIRSMDGVVCLQTDAAMNSGNSGGPLIHLPTGTVIGINTAVDSSADGIGFAISADEVRKAFPNFR